MTKPLDKNIVAKIDWAKLALKK